MNDEVPIYDETGWAFSKDADECRFCGGMFEPDEMDDHDCDDGEEEQ